MNELKVFQNSEFGELGILLIAGKEYFPATQCAKIIGHQNPARAVRRYCKGVTKMITPTDDGTQEVNYIPEGDLYCLIVNSKLSAAERFERWVFDDVLPVLRKYGGYGEIQLEELIAKTVTVTVTETIKQLMPLMQPQNAVCKNPLKEDTRARRLKQSKIAQLKPELRVIVDDMILSRQYRYIDIQAFLSLHASSICLARPIAPDEEYAVWHIDCDGRGVWGGTYFPSQEEAEQFYADRCFPSLNLNCQTAECL